MVDTETHKMLAEIPVGVEPEGMGISPDGKVVINTSGNHQHGAFHQLGTL